MRKANDITTHIQLKHTLSLPLLTPILSSASRSLTIWDDDLGCKLLHIRSTTAPPQAKSSRSPFMMSPACTGEEEGERMQGPYGKGMTKLG